MARRVITVRKRSCGKIMFSQACVKKSASGQTPPPGRHPYPPPQQMAPAADGMHPTGMHSCVNGCFCLPSTTPARLLAAIIPGWSLFPHTFSSGALRYEHSNSHFWNPSTLTEWTMGTMIDLQIAQFLGKVTLRVGGFSNNVWWIVFSSSTWYWYIVHSSWNDGFRMLYFRSSWVVN